MKIKVTVKNVYGNQTVYPACGASELLAKLSGNKTLTKQSINILKELGYEIEIVQNIKL